MNVLHDQCYQACGEYLSPGLSRLNSRPRRLRDGDPAVNRRTQGVLLVGSLLVGSLVIATVVMLAMALARGLDHHHCKTGFPTVISCTFTW
jgi:hypothetical protein